VSDRGFTLVEALLALGVMAIVLTSAMGVVVALPRQAARWEDAAEARQRLRVVDARASRLAANAAPIDVRVGAAMVRVPGVWPRRLGLTRAGAPGDVSPEAVTFLSRADGHRSLVLDETLAAGGGAVAARGQAGCGTAPACRVVEGDLLLAVSAASALGLYRVSDVGGQLPGGAVVLTLEALMTGPSSGAGSVLVPVGVASLEFDGAAGEVRIYDGYRSDNIVADGLATVAFALESGALLGDGPWVGAGPLAFDADQLSVRTVRAEAGLVLQPERGNEAVRFGWRLR
jgi:prepilin-type N-terminal cleavage/methylation domain-containing protein